MDYLCAMAEAPASSYSLTPQEESALRHEVAFQCWSALLALEQLRGLVQVVPPALEALRGTEGEADMPWDSEVVQQFLKWQVLIWSHVRTIASAASVVSLVLWPYTRRPPSGGKKREAAARAAELRVRWGLPEKSILEDREVRDVLEHVDEKLVAWLREKKPKALEGLSIKEVPPSGPPNPEEVFRVLDPKTLIVWAGGQKCRLVDVTAELDRITRNLPPTTGGKIRIELPKASSKQ